MIPKLNYLAMFQEGCESIGKGKINGRQVILFVKDDPRSWSNVTANRFKCSFHRLLLLHVQHSMFKRSMTCVLALEAVVKNSMCDHERSRNREPSTARVWQCKPW